MKNRHRLMLLRFTDLTNVIEEVTIHRPNVNLKVFQLFLRKINLSTCFDFNRDLWEVTISPAVETLSKGTQVAGMQRYFLAILANEGYLSQF